MDDHERLTQIELKEDSLLRISYSALASLLAALVGFVIWLTLLNATTQANAEDIVGVREDVSQITEALIKIDRKLSQIQALLEKRIID